MAILKLIHRTGQWPRGNIIENLTRYSLYRETADFFSNKNDNALSRFAWRRTLSKVFDQSATLIDGLEFIIYFEGGGQSFIDRFHNNLKKIERTDLWRAMNAALNKKKKPTRRNVDVSTNLFLEVTSTIADYQNKILNKAFHGGNKIVDFVNKERLQQCFLSYSYDDKGLTLSLYCHFRINGSFLFVNWMWSPFKSNGAKVKTDLSRQLDESSQLLFLRSPRSEFHLPGGNGMIRQWCSWEIGYFYSRHPSEEYLVSFSDKSQNNNALLDGFKQMVSIEYGRVVASRNECDF